jgi:hypothetical protein
MSKLKEAAESLLKVADAIEKDAAEVSEFVCDKCNHTATLATINEKRHEAASQSGVEVKVADITVNDKINCPACDGAMAFRANEASAPYYIDDSEKTAENEKKADEPIDYDSLQRYAKKD